MPLDWNLIPASEIPFAPYPSRRSVVFGTKGIVAASQTGAVQAGLEILNKGGNAADAAVAVAAALNVTEPSCTGIGGDAFALFYNARDRTVKGLNGSGRSPAALSMEYVRTRGIEGRTIPLTDINSVTVPGAAAAWCSTVEEFGSGRVTMEEILAPAIRMAELGVPVAELNAHAWQRSLNLILSASPSANEMLLNGRAPKAGEIMTFPELAETFKAVAKEGKKGFYQGRIAEEIVRLVKDKGGCMTMEDLAAHETEKIEPITYSYQQANGVDVHECPPNGQGLTALLALGILDEMESSGKIPDLLKMTHNSPEYLHAIIEALRLAFADTRYYVTDPDEKFGHVPVKEMLSKDYLKARAQLFDADAAGQSVHHGSPTASTDTVYFTCADDEGNAISFIASNYAGFGTGAIPHGCGFTLQNRGAGFTLEEGHPNKLEGGKRPYHTIIPAMVTRNGDLFCSMGVMGGFNQPQGHVQVLLNLLRGMSAQEALDAPRFCISPGLPSSDANNSSNAKAGDFDSEVNIEEGVSKETIEKLRSMGHDAISASGHARMVVGRGQVIQQLKDKETGRRVWAAGSDLRADGHAAAQI